ncbi:MULTISPECIES: OFA family MFS transporter [unclassified Mesorhizobium]|uniref:L-lactate MFS transporter n=1 Tax=unclassified Mesorhizobium TaxID=325217 RepID=UPI00112EB78F|nr:MULTISPECIES: OFA family MFS transporter [unclassified Mesorhizobium]TPL00618.1 OFA family MFS transporter [Mesorhizobium sp. B2-4-16]TPL63641.1 OFA family MFS transporter [Mesorhizobium sp. B2-4-3]
MTTTTVEGAGGWLDRSHTIAERGFSRWMVPPAALCIHLCIGQAYAFSVFNLPMSKLIGITESAPDDWKLTGLGWIFSIAILFLGIAAAFGGGWLDRVGPRKAMVAAACCFGGGFIISALGVYLHQLWIIYLGYGVLGGIGLGLGYISPVKTLITWFPDRPGMATGMAIMGFGGGAFIASPLSVYLMSLFSTPEHIGVAETFITLGIVYFIFMMIGAIIVRVPPEGWRPAGWTPPATQAAMVTSANVHLDDALKTPQFWLLWGVLCLNVTAGIGVLGQASAMSQEMFPGRITAAAAAGFVGLLSIFNMLGRFFWASTSDYIGRKLTYAIFFVLGVILYAAVPWTGKSGNVFLFVLFYGIILSMYGGGFSTVPAYLRDVFGVRYVGAIHGRLLTAWSVAGVLGPVLVNYIRQYQIDSGVAKADAYTVTMYIMAGLLVVGFLLNLMMRPVAERFHMKPEAARA